MADVRAEILAASRSGKGWHNEKKVTPIQNRIRFSALKSNFEGDESLNANSSKMEATRKNIGSKVSQMAHLFQNMTPTNASDNIFLARPGLIKEEISKVEPKMKQVSEPIIEQEKIKTPPLSRNVDNNALNNTHVRRFNSARALFARMEEENLKYRIVSPPLPKRKTTSGSRSGSTSPGGQLSPARSALSPTRSSVCSSPRTPSPDLPGLAKPRSTSDPIHPEKLEQNTLSNSLSESAPAFIDNSHEVCNTRPAFSNEGSIEDLHTGSIAQLVPDHSKENIPDSKIENSIIEKFNDKEIKVIASRLIGVFENKEKVEIIKDCKTNSSSSCTVHSRQRSKESEYKIAVIRKYQDKKEDTSIQDVDNDAESEKQKDDKKLQKTNTIKEALQKKLDNSAQKNKDSDSTKKALPALRNREWTRKDSDDNKEKCLPFQQKAELVRKKFRQQALEKALDEKSDATKEELASNEEQSNKIESEIQTETKDSPVFTSNRKAPFIPRQDKGSEIASEKKPFPTPVIKKQRRSSDEGSSQDESKPPILMDTTSMPPSSPPVTIKTGGSYSPPVIRSAIANSKKENFDDSPFEGNNTSPLERLPMDIIESTNLQNEKDTLDELDTINQADKNFTNLDIPNLDITNLDIPNLDIPLKPADMSVSEDVEFMTPEEAVKLLSKTTREEILSDEEAQEIKHLLDVTCESILQSSAAEQSTISLEEYNAFEETSLDTPEIHPLDDGHFFIEVLGLPEEDDDDNEDYPTELLPRKVSKVKFSSDPIRIYSTYSVAEYDRKNEDVDPVSASAEYELEKRVEKMNVFPVDLMKGPEGLGLSIIGMGVGADAGLEKLGIFVKTITEGGAAQKDGRIQVNDQIIEVDGKSLVGVTQAYAASVLRSTAGLVKFSIGREKDTAQSEVAQLISQSLQQDREREEQRRFQEQLEDKFGSEDLSPPPPPSTDDEDSLPLSEYIPEQSPTQELPSSPEDEGPATILFDVLDLDDGSSDSLSPDTDMHTVMIKLKEMHYKNAVMEADILKMRERLSLLDNLEAQKETLQKRSDAMTQRIRDVERALDSTKKEVLNYQDMLEESQGQYIALEKKYYKAKKLIKEFQQREVDFIQRDEYHLQQIQEKDQEYNALVKTLKDRIIQLEQDLIETQKAAGLPVHLPRESSPHRDLLREMQQKRKGAAPPQLVLNIKKIEADVSDAELSDFDNKYDISPDSDDSDATKISTVERKPPSSSSSSSQSTGNFSSTTEAPPPPPPPPPLPVSEDNNDDDEELLPPPPSPSEDVFEQAIPETELLDSSAAKAKAELASKGSLANRQPPSMVKRSPVPNSNELNLSGDLDDRDIELANGSTSSTPSSSPKTYPKPLPGFDLSMAKAIAQEAALKAKAVAAANIAATTACTFTSEQSTDTESSAGSDNGAPGIGGLENDSVLGLEEDEIDSVSINDLQASSRAQRDQAAEAKRAYRWQNCPVTEWSSTQVSQWLLGMEMEQYIPRFAGQNINGPELLQLDSSKLRTLGVMSSNDRAIIKKKVKELKAAFEKEKKAQEKEQRAKEKLQKKAMKKKS